jgi:hypothetical protein
MSQGDRRVKAELVGLVLFLSVLLLGLAGCHSWWLDQLPVAGYYGVLVVAWVLSRPPSRLLP